MADMVKEWWVVANIGRGSSVDQASKNIGKLKSAFPHGQPVYGLCEIDEGDTGDEHGILKQTWPDYKWARFSEMVPIGFDPTHWEIEYAKLIPTHPGLSGVTPQRPIVEARLRRNGHDWCVVHAISSHAVAGAFTHPDQSHERERRDYWFWWWGALKARLHELTAKGNAWVFMADTNRPHMPQLHKDEKRWVDGGSSGLDYVIGCDGDHVHFKKTDSKRIDLTIDGHNAHGALTEIHHS